MSLNIFISWSGIRSRKIAIAVKELLESVFSNVKIWVSFDDIPNGSRFAHVLANTLDENNIGIICLTPENKLRPWIQFEAGALSKHVRESNLFTFLSELTPADLNDSPLAQFQHTFSDQQSILKLLRDINNLFPDDKKLQPKPLEAAFRGHWRKFNKSLQNALAEKSGMKKNESLSIRTYSPLPNTKNLYSLIKIERFDEEERVKRVCNEVERQLDEFKIIPATGVGRTLIHLEQYELALRVFEFLLKKVPPLHPDLYIIYGNIAYCLVGMAHYKEALSYFQKVKELNNGNTYFAWHAIPAAYCHWKLGELEKYREELNFAKSRQEYHKEIEASEKLYPEIAEDL